MKVEMLMPKMGESITEGTILKWLKQVGDVLEKDEIILEISTDKVDSEIPTPEAGTLLELMAAEGETVDVGKVIAIIEVEAAVGNKAGDAPQTGADKSPVEAESMQEPQVSTETEVQPQPLGDASERNRLADRPKGNRFYSPVVMNIARKNNLSLELLEQISGTGLNGRVTKKNILEFLEARPSSAGSAKAAPTQSTTMPAEGIEIVPMDNMRKTIARHMIHSKHTSAHVNLYTEVDMHNISKIRDQKKSVFKRNEGYSLTYMPFIVEATVKALREFPMLNARIEGENIIKQNFFNIGIAVAVENGLIVPNIFNCDEKNLVGIARSINDIALRSRNKKLNPDELSNGTFSISNFGVYGTSIGFPIINQPQVAILGVGAIKKRAVVIDDAIAIRPVMYLALTIDHRLIDGAMGARFLEHIRQTLEQYDPSLDI